ncbi:hypothetical protein [Salinibacterium sp.]|uniref:hypothetical protein n=1 Tax=Salinibacterium sp. TaxID=1915057 RepID=UPI00286CF6A8|nr:hypothetical protein [Salinibacterium sp.]
MVAPFITLLPVLFYIAGVDGINVLPWIFRGLVLLAVITYVYLRRNRPDVIARIGNTEMESLGGIG